MSKVHDIAIVGGGLAGLSNAIHLSKSGLKVCLIEKNEFPKHKVCGEYISNEVTPYLRWLGINPFEHGATQLKRFELSTRTGQKISTSLPLGGFGISRYRLDNIMMLKAKEVGCTVVKDSVENIRFDDNHFFLKTKSSHTIEAKFTIGAHGKRSNLDNQLERAFFKSPAPFLGVKAHYKGDFDPELVALHNFNGGYCGVSKVEDGFINICYLANFESFKKHKDLKSFQKNVIESNPHLKTIFTNCEMAFEKPLTISQISFLPKPTVEDHILMSGDAAGMIHPLCGNGMGMAIHSAMILSELLISYFQGNVDNRKILERQYQMQWDKVFSNRLRAGKLFNRFLGNKSIFENGLRLLTNFPSALPALIRQTHGTAIKVPTRRAVLS